MIVFILTAIKTIASLFCFMSPSLVSFSASSLPMLLTWTTDDSSAELFAFKSDFWLILFCLYILLWIVTPWLMISSRRGVAIVGFSLVIGLNLFDIICCMLCALPIPEKMINLSFSVLIVLLSIRAIRKI